MPLSRMFCNAVRERHYVVVFTSDERISERRLDRDLDAELQFHIEARTDELIAKGLAPEDAAREARRHFGNRLLLRESSRDVKLISWIESVLQDLRFGLRMLRKNAGLQLRQCCLSRSRSAHVRRRFR